MSTRGSNTATASGRERAPRLPSSTANSRAAHGAPAGQPPTRLVAARTLARNLHAAEDRIAAAPVERAFAYSPADGRQILEKGGEVVGRGNARGLEIGQGVFFSPAEFARMRGAVVTHNHPMGSSLSAEDVRMAYKHDFAQIRAVTPERVYVLDRPRGGWGRWDGPEGDGALLGHIKGRLVTAWRAEVLSGRIAQRDAERIVADAVMRVFAEQTGLRYRSVPRRGGRSSRAAIAAA